MRVSQGRDPLDSYAEGARLLVKLAFFGDMVAGPIHDLLVSGAKPKVDEELSDRLIASAKKRGIGVDINPGVPDHFNPRTKRVSVQGKTPSLLAHEIGHANIEKSRLGRLLQNRYTLTAGGLSPVAGLASGGARGALAARRGDERDGLGATVGKSLIVPGLLAAPQLAYEGLASIKGMRMLRRAGASKPIVDNARKTLGRYWGTYALQPTAGAINDAAAYHAAYSLAEKEE